MAEAGELSKRIDDLHRRVEGLRGDMNVRFGELRADMNTRFAVVDRRVKILNWLITVWFTLLTLLIVLFRFLRF